MILFPNAKINLGLEITSRRPDGYHNLDTVFYPIDWCDILEIVPAASENCTLTTTGNKVDCAPEKNLVMRAWHVMNSHVPIPPVDIHLHKIVPDGAGLGGGSSDAAFTLKGLNEMFALGIDNEILAEYAAEIGADCPFFIYNRPMRATGIGNIFSPLNISLSGYLLLIVKPPVSVSTKQAYSNVTPAPATTDINNTLAALTPDKWQQLIVNRFEQSVFPQFPSIGQLKEQILQLGADYASMSGSGSSVFGIFPASKADIMSDFIESLPPQYISHISAMQF